MEQIGMLWNGLNGMGLIGMVRNGMEWVEAEW